MSDIVIKKPDLNSADVNRNMATVDTWIHDTADKINFRIQAQDKLVEAMAASIKALQDNQNAFGAILVGNTLIQPGGETDTLELEAGSNVTLTPDAANKKVTISALGRAQILTQDKSFTNTSERVSLPSGTTSKTVLSVTAPFAGYAVITGNVAMTTDATGNRNVSVSVAGETIVQDTRAANSTNNGNLGIAAVASVSSGDVVAIQAWQSSGSTLYGGGHLGVMFIEA